MFNNHIPDGSCSAETIFARLVLSRFRALNFYIGALGINDHFLLNQISGVPQKKTKAGYDIDCMTWILRGDQTNDHCLS